jgi:hypothetical protein
MIALFALLAAAADPVAGTWVGTSLCQIRPSPCHDEQVVYKIKATGQQRYRIEAYKIIAGQEQYMGPLDLRFDAAAHRLNGSNRDRAGIDHPWIFTLRGNHMSGRALTGDGKIFRLIEIDRR